MKGKRVQLVDGRIGHIAHEFRPAETNQGGWLFDVFSNHRVPLLMARGIKENELTVLAE